MKPRHAAALALVGWYLLVPPDRDDARLRFAQKWDYDFGKALVGEGVIDFYRIPKG